jgi:2-polyprenyl-3-methyl-5-hydroxy-6-metoxy-1,4-benzoquinol methylase
MAEQATAEASTNACSACGSGAAPRYRFTVNGCPIQQCPACGLGHAEPGGFEPTTYYTADYFNGSHSDGYADYRGAEPVLRKEFARTVGFIRKIVPSGRLLDIGCAYGFFLQEAKPFYEVSGIELAADAAAYCRANGLDVHAGIADENALSRVGPLDGITLFDVIEHLPEPHDVLSLAARHLKPGGIVVLTTGDFGSLAAKLMGPKWRLMTPPQHLWFFTRESVRRIGARCGLTMTHFTHPGKVVPLSLIGFQMRRMLGLRPAPSAAASRIGVPVNLFDAMRVVLRKES